MEKQLRIIILEDLPSDVELTERELKTVLKNYTLRVVDTEKDFVQALSAFKPDLIISDYQMPAFDGLSALQITREKSPFTPFIVLTGSMNEDTAVKCMKAGADDYVIKENITRLGSAVSNALVKKKMEREHQQTLETLRKSEQKYRHLVESNIDWVWSCDLEGRQTFTNESVKNILGYDVHEVMGTLAYRLMHPEDAKRVQRWFKTSIEAKKGWSNIVLRWKHKDGTIRFLESTARPILDSRGDLIGFIGTDRDVTERIRVERQLYQAQKMEAIGTLTGGIAHDFNNLLTTIIGYSESALKDLVEDTSLYNTVAEIVKAGRRAALLTRQLLAFSRKQVIQPEILNINDILTDTEKMLNRIIGEDINMISRFASELWNVEMDPGQIEQVLMNLAVNARDAMPKGGKLIIETANEMLDKAYFIDHGIEGRPGPYVTLTVMDTGVGMDKRTLSHIFEPFYTTKTGGKGTGLGLSTVYGIVKQNKGHIWAYSEHNKGARFKVYLPATMQDIEVTKGEAKVSEDRLRGTETILLVEDDDRLRKMVRKVLEAQGYKVLSAPDSKEGLKISNEYYDSIHLLLTDIILPGMNGVEMAKQIESQRSEIKTIYMSGYIDNVIVNRELLDKDINFIQKPFSSDDIVRRAREILDQYKEK